MDYFIGPASCHLGNYRKWPQIKLKANNFFFGCVCRIFVPQPGIELMAPAMEAQSPNHWTTTEFPVDF